MEFLVGGISVTVGFFIGFFFKGTNTKSEIQDLEQALADSKTVNKNLTASNSALAEARDAAYKEALSLKKQLGDLQQGYAELERDAIGFKNAWDKALKEKIAVENELSIQITKGIISKANAKKGIEEATRLIDIHANTLKELGLTDFSVEGFDAFIANSTDVDIAKMASEFGSWMKWIGRREALEERIK